MADYDVLIKLIDATHPDTETDRKGCYKKGDIVEVRTPGTYERGREEAPPKFALLHITNAPEGLKRVLESPEFADFPAAEKVVHRRRQHHLNTDAIPAGIWEELISNGTYSLPWGTAKKYLFNKSKGKSL